MKFRQGLWACALMGATMSSMATARQDIRLDTQTFVERVTTDVNGRARRMLATPDRIARGDQLIFIVNWRNAGERPLSALSLSNPVPETVRIKADDPNMQVSVDGGLHWGRIDQLWMPTALGGTRRATTEDVTHIRWAMPGTVSPGQSGRISYRGVVR